MDVNTPVNFKAVLDDAISKLETMKPYYEPINVDSAIIVGDTHGFPEISMKAIQLYNEYSADILVFLGDYVDRGPLGVENLKTVLEAFISNPNRVLILRGNHESLYMNQNYGFYGEVLDKLGSGLLNDIDRLYNLLPYIAIVNGYLLVHGGVPCSRCKPSFEPPLKLSDIQEALENVRGRDPLMEEDERSSIATQLLWNDPNASIDWFSPSIRGPGIYYYGRKAWTSFLEANRLKGIIRAHEVVDAVALSRNNGTVKTGFKEGDVISHDEAKNSVITVFSSKYHGMGAGILYMTRDGFKIHVY
ncbi:MAG: metallophosphoesterase [Desulfurococcales archaeon]|nr:metallophosphoesterase [Desulfurococcales archaeon]